MYPPGVSQNSRSEAELSFRKLWDSHVIAVPQIGEPLTLFWIKPAGKKTEPGRIRLVPFVLPKHSVHQGRKLLSHEGGTQPVEFLIAIDNAHRLYDFGVLVVDPKQPDKERATRSLVMSAESHFRTRAKEDERDASSRAAKEFAGEVVVVKTSTGFGAYYVPKLEDKEKLEHRHAHRSVARHGQHAPLENLATLAVVSQGSAEISYIHGGLLGQSETLLQVGRLSFDESKTPKWPLWTTRINQAKAELAEIKTPDYEAVFTL